MIRKRKKRTMNYSRGKHPNSIASRFKKGESHPEWRGGVIFRKGYAFIYAPNHKYSNGKGYIREHRLVIEKQIGRYLKSTERTHHLNKIKIDNSPENLMLFINGSAHQRFHGNPNNVKPKEIIFDGRQLENVLRGEK